MRHGLMTILAAGLMLTAIGCDMAGSGLPEGQLVQSKDAMVTVTSAGGEVTVDGMLDEAAWKSAVAMSDFVKGRADKPEVETRLLVTYDKDNLYLATISVEPDTDQLTANATEHDGAVWKDDAVELYVDPSGERAGTMRDYRMFCVNTVNTHYDRGPAESWDPEWSSGVKVIDGTAWVAEVAIPFKALGVTPKPGTKLALQVGRNRRTSVKTTYYLVPCNEEAKDTGSYVQIELK